MTFLTRLFGGQSNNGSTSIDILSDSPDKIKVKQNPDGIVGLTKWQIVLVPAFERPFSKRCLAVASRLARGSGGTVLLSSHLLHEVELIADPDVLATMDIVRVRKQGER